MLEAIAGTIFAYIVMTMIALLIIAIITGVMEHTTKYIDKEGVISCVFAISAIVLYIMVAVRWMDFIYKFFLSK
jgi:hypothetical protein